MKLTVVHVLVEPPEARVRRIVQRRALVGLVADGEEEGGDWAFVEPGDKNKGEGLGDGEERRGEERRGEEIEGARRAVPVLLVPNVSLVHRVPAPLVETSRDNLVP